MMKLKRLAARSRSRSFAETGWQAARRLPAIATNTAGCSSWELTLARTSFMKRLPGQSALRAGLRLLLQRHYGVEVVSRKDSETTYYFLLNLTLNAPGDIALPHPMQGLIAERTAVRTVSLGLLDVAALALPKSAGTKRQE